jgi:hydrogenase maturation protease
VTDLRVIGVGNRWRGDDAVGLAVADAIRDLTPSGVTVLESDGDPATLLDLWEGAAAIVLVDAVDSGDPAGTILRFDATEEAIPATHFRQSSHALGIGEAIELGRVLGRLPERVVFYGIAAGCFDPGTPMNEEVAAAVLATAHRIVAEIGGA